MNIRGILSLRGANTWLWMLLALFLAHPLAAADWPAFRADVQRSAVTAEAIQLPLATAWRHTCAQAPAPAWQSLSRTINRLEFDYAPQPVVAAGILVFGSSADDTIYALDAATGELKWRFVTGGPVRFAPQLANDRVYAGSDDGWVYCLELGTGREVWKFHAAPNADCILGDSRMISRWPLRCGVLVDAGVVYTVAGMWPSEGVFIYALDAASGNMLWCNDTGGAITPWDAAFKNQPVYFFGNWTGLAPQGLLLASKDTLVVPMGRALPAGVDRQTGILESFNPGRKLSYSTAPPFAMVGDAAYIYTSSSKGAANRSQGQQVGFYNPGKSSRAMLVLKDLPQPTGVLDPGKGLDVALLVTPDRFYAQQGYSIALAGETLLVGQDGAVVAFSTRGQNARPPKVKTKGKSPTHYDLAPDAEIWRAAVNGQARGLAVAGGRVFVSTDKGEIYCFAPGVAGGAPQHHNPAAKLKPTATEPAVAPTIEVLRRAGMDLGYALVLGDADGRTATALAAQTRLRVVSVAADAAAAASLRQRLLDTTALHGSRIQVFAAPADGALPFPRYFANAVILAGNPGKIPAPELYRVLRPAGGIMLAPGLPIANAQTIFKAAGAPAVAIQPGNPPSLLRPALPEALDWDSSASTGKRTALETDRHLRAPLRPLWFGGPAPMEFFEKQAVYPNMAFSRGRFFYLIRGQLAASDAYNGSELWRTYVPRDVREINLAGERWLLDTAGYQAQFGWGREKIAAFKRLPGAIRALNADADSVYLTINGHAFRNAGATVLKIDAASGRQLAVYGKPAAGEKFQLRTPQTWTLKVDDKGDGRITMAATAAGITLELATKDQVVTDADFWTLFFDFRPAAERYGLYGRGTFQVRILPVSATRTAAAWRHLRGEICPQFQVNGKRLPDGTFTTVLLPWQEIEKAAGARPKTFGFAVGLRSFDGDGKTDVKQDEETEEDAKDNGDDPDALVEEAAVAGLERFLFGDVLAEAVNNGWATIMLEDAPADLAALAAPTVVAGPVEKLPAELLAPRQRRSYASPDRETAKAPRRHPLSGETGVKLYNRGNGCGQIYSSAFVNYMRSGTLGYYDLLEDAGIRHFGGIRPSCVDNMLAVFGVLYVTDDSGGCVCQYSFQTPLALAEPDRRLHEDWALYTDLPVDSRVRQAALNLGAPGDRRDGQGKLWLNFPRFKQPCIGIRPGGQEPASFLHGIWPTAKGPNFEIPLKVEHAKGLGPHRVNADRVAIRNTDRPWLYASQYRGLTRLLLQTDMSRPLTAEETPAPPRPDGRLDDGEWGEKPAITLSNTKTEVYLRRDAQNLYIAARRPAVIAKKGKPTPWLANAKGNDAEIWHDDSFEVFLSDAGAKAVIHLGISASGARYDALASAGNAAGDPKWNGNWQGGISANEENSLVAEFAIPLATLTDAGLDKAALGLNLMSNQPTGAKPPSKNAPPVMGSEAFCYLGGHGRARCGNFFPLGLTGPAALPERSFTVRLHFAELDESVGAGRRVFDVKLQGATVLKDFDVAKEAGGALKALVKEFNGVRAGAEIKLEFAGQNPKPGPTTAPILNAIEIAEE